MSELFSERLFAARRAIGKKSKQIAEECGISPAYYSQIESATRGTPALPLVNKLAVACGVTPESLLNNLPSLAGGEPVGGEKSGIRYPEHKESFVHSAVEPTPCPLCAAKDKEIAWLRSTITNLQENFRAALAAVERKNQP
jgi:transcriptional regulator with XRE-family HTH domain